MNRRKQILGQCPHDAYLFCIERAMRACQIKNKTAILFWGHQATKLGESLGY